MTVEEAFEEKLSDIPVTIEGKVVEILADDTQGRPHQRFIVQTPASRSPRVEAGQGGHRGHTVLISHNLERAYRVPIKIGDKVGVHGTYEWNSLGGIIHKTYHDGRGIHEDGWINFAGKKQPNFSKKR